MPNARALQDEEQARRTKYPPLPGGEDWLTIYASDYTAKDMVPRLDYVGVLTELVSTGIPRAPLGRSLFAAYDDPTRCATFSYKLGRDFGRGEHANDCVELHPSGRPPLVAPVWLIFCRLRFRRSPHTVPVYRPDRPVIRPARRDIWEQWYEDFPVDSEYAVSYGRNAYNTTRKCQPFKNPLLPELAIG